MGNILEITETRPTVQVTEAGNTLQVVAPNSIVITDVTPTVTITSSRPQVIVANAGIQGPIGINWRGAYSSAEYYYKSDAIEYGGSAYYCLVEHGAAGEALPPSTNTTKWELIVSNGAVGINWRGSWSSLGTYALLDSVEHKGSSWLCTKVPNTNQEPPTTSFSNNLYWDLIAATAFIHKGNYNPSARQNLNETVIKNGQMWRCKVDGNTTAPPDHPFENTSNWEYVTTAWRNLGTWDLSTTPAYFQNEVVTYEGSSYLCIRADGIPTVNNPTFTNHWDLIASKGDQGIQGTQGIVWTGDWSPLPTYEVDEAVYYLLGGKSYICTQQHLAITRVPENGTNWEDYWDILADKGDTGPVSTEPGPTGGSVGTGYTFDLLDTTGGSSADGNCRLNVVASDVSLATKCWLSNKDNDGNDLSTYMLSFEDATSPVKCYLNIAKMGEGAKFVTWTVSSITSNAGGWKELTLIEPKAYSDNAPFGFLELLNIGMNRTGDRGTNWKGDWSSATAYLLSDAVMQDGATWICTQAGTNQKPVDGSAYWDLMASGGVSSGSGVVGAGYLFDTGTANTPLSAEIRFDSTLSGSTDFVHIHEVDILGANNEKLFTEWLGGTDSTVKGYIKLTSANDNTRWWGAEVISLTTPSSEVHSLGIQNITSPLESSSTFSDEEKLVISLSRTGDKGVNLRGTYVGGTQYQLGDVVTYLSNSWVCTTATTSAPSSSSTNWNEFALGMHYRADWDDSIGYYLNDIVRHLGTAYISVHNGYQSNQTPTAGTSYWNVMVSDGADGADGADGEDGLANTMPVGSIIMWSGHLAPTDTSWLVCNGQEINRDTYSVLNALFLAAGYPYGMGNNDDTFNLPDMREKFVTGMKLVDDTFGSSLGDTGGEEEVTLIKSHMPNHTHKVLTDFQFLDNNSIHYEIYDWQRFFEHDGDGMSDDNDNSGDDPVPNDMHMENFGAGSQYKSLYDYRYDNGYTDSRQSPDYLQAEGGNVAHNNIPPFVIVNYIIKVKVNAAP